MRMTMSPLPLRRRQTSVICRVPDFDSSEPTKATPGGSWRSAGMRFTYTSGILAAATSLVTRGVASVSTGLMMIASTCWAMKFCVWLSWRPMSFWASSNWIDTFASWARSRMAARTVVRKLSSNSAMETPMVRAGAAPGSARSNNAARSTGKLRFMAPLSLTVRRVCVVASAHLEERAPGVDRRQFLEAVAGISSMVPALALLPAIEPGAFAASLHARAQAAGRLRTLSEAQDATLETIAEILLPQTDTVGARAVAVNRFIDLLLSESMLEADRDRFLEGLAAIDARSQSLYGAAFVAARRVDQEALIGALDGQLP